GNFRIFWCLVRCVWSAPAPEFSGTTRYGRNLADCSALSSVARGSAPGPERMAAYPAIYIFLDSNRGGDFQWIAVRHGIDQFQMVWRDHPDRRYWYTVRLAGPCAGERQWKGIGGGGGGRDSRTQELKESEAKKNQQSRAEFRIEPFSTS